MMITDFFTNAGLFSKVATVIGVVPLALGVVYAVWPTEERLALATIFAAISGMVVGVLNALLWAANQDPGAFTRIAAIGVSEALVPVFFGFGCLTVAWLCVAVGLWRRP
jgi:hypothetical protein